MAGYLREDHAFIVRIKDKPEDFGKDALGHRAAILNEIKNTTPVIREIQNTSARASDMAEKTCHILAKGDPSPWEQGVAHGRG